ncbi:hypothetical protein [Roseateles sp. LYH14W]|uniref:Uncharacterized protein n=1 Tax=Pelomonas parva TaxID=3299032 RepID=A0ABW7EXS0_9BURK
MFPDLPLTTNGSDCFKELAAHEALDDAYHDAIGMPQAAASHRVRLGPCTATTASSACTANRPR